MSLFNPKQKGLFVEVSEYAILAAQTSALNPPFVIESLEVAPAEKPEKVDAFIKEVSQFNKTSGYVRGYCGVYPRHRFFKRHTIDKPGQAKAPNYFPDLLKNQYKIEVDKNKIAILHTHGGGALNLEDKNSKELIFAGAPEQEFAMLQQNLLEKQIYSSSLELGSLSSLGGIMHYSKTSGANAPVMVLEIGTEKIHLFICGQGQLEVCRTLDFGLDSMYPALQEALNLQDKESAKKLMLSNTFDFTEMGPSLLGKMIKEVEASMGFYEVQTGQAIGAIFITLLPPSLNWVGTVLAKSLGVELLSPNYATWLKNFEISFAEHINIASLGSRWFGVFSLMGNYKSLEGL